MPKAKKWLRITGIAKECDDVKIAVKKPEFTNGGKCAILSEQGQ